MFCIVFFFVANKIDDDDDVIVCEVTQLLFLIGSFLPLEQALLAGVAKRSNI